MSGKGWYAVLTRPSAEDLAAASIRFAGTKVFLPRAKKERSAHGVRQWTIRPLFPRYLFAQFSVPDELDPVRYARGVVRVLGTRSTPQEIGEELIDGLKRTLSSDGYLEIREEPAKSGDRVAIHGGLFDGLLGRIEREFDDGKRVALLLDSLQQGPVIVEKRFVRAAAAT